MRVVDRRIPWGTRVTLALAGLAALGATLINPYGVHMWTFLGETVRLGRDDIEEWGSILTYPVALGLPWALTLTAAALAFWRSERPRPYDYFAIVALLAFASFRVSRLDAFFALAVVILLAPELASAIASLVRRSDAPAVSCVRQARRPLASSRSQSSRWPRWLVPAARIIGPVRHVPDHCRAVGA